MAILLLSACSDSQKVSIKMMGRAFELNQQQPAHHFDPRFEYLRINSEGRVFYLLKAYKVNGIEVWYGSSGETLRFKDGRLGGAIGLLTEWRNVVIPESPSWSALVKGNATYRWKRKRDLKPGYHYGIQDELALSRISTPIDSHLAGLSPEKLIWFEESDLSKTNQLPIAKYAYDTSSQTVVYGETCLSSTFCFSWQRWSENLQ
ncbi:MAG: YjbF family lipoprotein [Gallionella sp.]|nr:YjbF family lipoprotein [Gallionella sp.]